MEKTKEGKPVIKSTMTIIYNKLNSVPESEFQLPPGVVVQDMYELHQAEYEKELLKPPPW